MPANDRQVGGSHYAAELQHWDVVEENNIGYLEGCASAYVTRCRKKGTRDEDLAKADHYIRKLIEIHERWGRKPRGFVEMEVIEHFARANHLTLLEREVVVLLFQWRNAGDLDRAKRLVGRLIDCEE